MSDFMKGVGTLFGASVLVAGSFYVGRNTAESDASAERPRITTDSDLDVTASGEATTTLPNTSTAAVGAVSVEATTTLPVGPQEILYRRSGLKCVGTLKLVTTVLYPGTSDYSLYLSIDQQLGAPGVRPLNTNFAIDVAEANGQDVTSPTFNPDNMPGQYNIVTPCTDTKTGIVIIP